MTTPSIRGRVPLVFPLIVCLTLLVLLGTSFRASAAPYAAVVMDARTGEILHSRNADTRLHPASLTKMMTLYIAFEAVRNGEIGLDSKVLVSKKAAAEVPSKLGLRAGQRIELRFLIRAAAIKSANDAATAIGEAISGSEAAFARRMNRTAKALGMTKTTFKNAHGLTQDGHLSTARDMTILGRHLFYDYPEYYNLFSRRSTNAKLAEVYNTNRRFLAAYRGADGIKTGYTRAAGFNLVSSAQRGDERIIATMFGGSSVAARNKRVAELLDMGFQRAAPNVAVRKPARPVYRDGPGTASKTIRVVRAVPKSIRPVARPGRSAPSAAPVLTAALQTEIENAVATAASEEVTAPSAEQVAEVATPKEAEKKGLKLAAVFAPKTEPKRRPASPRADFAVTRAEPATVPTAPEVVARVSTSGGRHWGINVGRYPSRFKAERVLLKTALKEMGTLDGALRKVAQKGGGFDANFVGMSKDQAALACRRLEARGSDCTTLGPSG